MHSINRYQPPSTQNAHGTQMGMTKHGLIPLALAQAKFQEWAQKKAEAEQQKRMQLTMHQQACAHAFLHPELPPEVKAAREKRCGARRGAGPADQQQAVVKEIDGEAGPIHGLYLLHPAPCGRLPALVSFTLCPHGGSPSVRLQDRAPVPSPLLALAGPSAPLPPCCRWKYPVPHLEAEEDKMRQRAKRKGKAA